LVGVLLCSDEFFLTDYFQLFRSSFRDLRMPASESARVRLGSFFALVRELLSFGAIGVSLPAPPRRCRFGANQPAATQVAWGSSFPDNRFKLIGYRFQRILPLSGNENAPVYAGAVIEGMNMRMRLIGLSLCLVLLALPAMSAPPAQQDGIAQVQARVQTQDKENDIAQVQAQVQTLDREVAILKAVSDNRLDAQDQRIGDLDIWTGQQGNHMAAISNVTTWVGTAITLIVFLAGFIGYFSAKNRASAEAKEASERWFQQNANVLRQQIGELREQANSLQSQLDTFRQKADDAHGEIDRLTAGVDDHARQNRQVIDQAAQKVLAVSGKHQDAQQPVDPSAIAAVQEASLALQAKPENAFTSDDHYARGLNEYIAKRFDSALSSFDKALLSARAESASPENLAKFLNARAVALGELDLCEEAIALYDEIDRLYGEDASPALRERVAKALYNKGVALGQRDRTEEAIAVYDQIDRRYGEDASPAICEPVAKALVSKGISLCQRDRMEDAIAVYDEVDHRYGEDASPALREHVALALYNKGVSLWHRDRSDDAIAVYDQIDRRYGEDTSSALREQVAWALYNKGASLGQRDRGEEEIAVYDEIDRRYGEDASPALRERVAMALVNKGVSLGQRDHTEDAIAVYDEIDRRYGEDASPALRERVAMALVNKGVTLGQRDHTEDAIAVYDEIDRRYGEDASPTLREPVAKALIGRASHRRLQAKQHWQTETERRDLLASAINDLARAKQQCATDDLATDLGSLGYALFLSGVLDEAEIHTRECLRLGQATSLEGLRGFARRHRVEPQDSEYERWLDRLSQEMRPKA
jgi:tetratricopeptide (TPR) repeat protein